MATVRLVSPNFNYTALRENDPYLSNLVPHSVESESIQIPDEVAPILSRQWDAYMRLIEWYNSTAFVAFTYNGKMPVMPPRILDPLLIENRIDVTWGQLLTGTSPITIDLLNPSLITPVFRLRLDDSDWILSTFISGRTVLLSVSVPDVFLREIDEIVHVANMPHGWEFLVNVDTGTPQKMRIRHLRRIGVVTSERILIAKASDVLESATPGVNAGMEYILMLDMIRHSRLTDVGYPQNGIIRYFFNGIMLNRYRRLALKDPSNAASKDVDCRGIIWKDIPVGLRKIVRTTFIQERLGRRETSKSEPLTESLVYKNNTRTIALPYAIRRGYNTITYLCGDSDYAPRYPTEHLSIVGLSTIANVRLYSTIIDSVLEHRHPDLFSKGGLSVLESIDNANSLRDVVGPVKTEDWVQVVIGNLLVREVMTVSREGQPPTLINSLTDETYTKAAIVMSDVLSNNALITILISVLEKINVDYNEGLDLFAQKLETLIHEEALN